jgi:hypothetical protein
MHMPPVLVHAYARRVLVDAYGRGVGPCHWWRLGCLMCRMGLPHLTRFVTHALASPDALAHVTHVTPGSNCSIIAPSSAGM